MSSLAEDLDRASPPSLQLHPPDIGETEPLPPDWYGGDDYCEHQELAGQPGRCRCGAALLEGDPDWVDRSPAIPAETTRRVVMQITSPERVPLKRYESRGGLRKKGQEGTAMQIVRLKVPKDIAELLPPQVDFTVELNEDGLLFRPAGASTKHDLTRLPAWARNGK